VMISSTEDDAECATTAGVTDADTSADGDTALAGDGEASTEGETATGEAARAGETAAEGEAARAGEMDAATETAGEATGGAAGAAPEPAVSEACARAAADTAGDGVGAVVATVSWSFRSGRAVSQGVLTGIRAGGRNQRGRHSRLGRPVARHGHEFDPACLYQLLGYSLGPPLTIHSRKVDGAWEVVAAVGAARAAGDGLGGELVDAVAIGATPLAEAGPEVVVGRALECGRRRNRVGAHGGRVVGRLRVRLDSAAVRVGEGQRRGGQEESERAVVHCGGILGDYSIKGALNEWM
jgi:hypothetical protein